MIGPAFISYVEAFEASSAGDKFNPHVTTGVGPKDYLDKMLERPFQAFAFTAPKAAVCQFGQWGTAAKKLMELK